MQISIFRNFKSIFMSAVIFLALISGANASSSMANLDDNATIDGMNRYQIRVMGGVWLMFQGAVAYFDAGGKVQIKKIFGNTPYFFNVDSKEGFKLFLQVSNMQTVSNIGGQFRAVVFQGDKYLDEKSVPMRYGLIMLEYGKYPDVNLEFMMPPMGYMR